MIRPLLTGSRLLRALCLACLTSLSLIASSAGLSAQGAAPSAGVSDDSSGGEGASAAPEPDTAMLLGTGSVVLLVLYARRRRSTIHRFPQTETKKQDVAADRAGVA